MKPASDERVDLREWGMGVEYELPKMIRDEILRLASEAFVTEFAERSKWRVMSVPWQSTTDVVLNLYFLSEEESFDFSLRDVFRDELAARESRHPEDASETYDVVRSLRRLADDIEHATNRAVERWKQDERLNEELKKESDA